MISPRIQKLEGLAIALSCASALSLWAPQLRADTRATVPAKSTRDDALAFLQINHIHKICEKPITFSVSNASLQDVAGRVEKLLQNSTAKPKFRIEVRNAGPVRLSFAAKKFAIGDVLASAADLAGARMWIFSDHLLLAPKKALSPTEQSLVKKGVVVETYGEFGQSGGRASTEKQLAFTAFISDEMIGLKPGAPGGQTDAFNSKLAEEVRRWDSPRSEKLVAGTTLGQLSPDAQEMIRQLSAPNLGGFPEKPFRPALAPDTLVAVLSGRITELYLFLPGPNDSHVGMSWEIGGSSTSIGVSGSGPGTPPTVPPPFDPSAGES